MNVSIYYPFKEVNQFYTAAYVYSRFKYLNDKNEIITLIEKIAKQKLSTEDFVFFTNKIDLNLQKIYPSDFFKNVIYIDREIANSTSNNNIYYSSFKISFDKCYSCKSQLSNENIQTFEAVVYFASSSTQRCNNINYVCKKCKAQHFFSYWINNRNQKFFYDDSHSRDFVSFSTRTIFEVTLLNTLTSDLMFKHTSFSAFSNSHNCNFENQNIERGALCYKRLTESWFYFHLLKYIKEFNNMNDFEVPDINQLDKSLETIRSSLSVNFTKKWSNGHYCKSKDCSKILNVDGIWKLNRLKCLFEDFMLCSEELAPVKIGCVKTPNRNSFYCSEHDIKEPFLCFNVNSIKTKFTLSSIKSTYINSNTKIIKIHDVYCEKKNENDGKDDDEDEQNINTREVENHVNPAFFTR
jgi:hypothetical protein